MLRINTELSKFITCIYCVFSLSLLNACGNQTMSNGVEVSGEKQSTYHESSKDFIYYSASDIELVNTSNVLIEKISSILDNSNITELQSGRKPIDNSDVLSPVVGMNNFDINQGSLATSVDDLAMQISEFFMLRKISSLNILETKLLSNDQENAVEYKLDKLSITFIIVDKVNGGAFIICRIEQNPQLGI